MPKHKRMRERDDGWCDWVQPVVSGYRMSCCDCGLVHNMEFRLHEGRIQFRASRHTRATAAMRTWKKRKARQANAAKARAAIKTEILSANGLKRRKSGSGVRCAKPGGKWTANIRVDGERKHLGTFETKEAAIAARKAAELKYWI